MKANESPDLSTDAARHPSFGGITYSPEQDGTRLTTAMERVVELMRDGRERTLAMIAIVRRMYRGGCVGSPERPPQAQDAQTLRSLHR